MLLVAFSCPLPTCIRPQLRWLLISSHLKDLGLSSCLPEDFQRHLQNLEAQEFMLLGATSTATKWKLPTGRVVLWVVIYMISQNILSGIELKLSTVETHLLMHLFFFKQQQKTFLPSLSHFSHFFTCDSWIRSANQFPTPSVLSQCFWGNPN